MDEESIRKRVRRMLEREEIPCDEPDTLWAGNGTGERCIACAEPIAPTDVEYEVEFSGTAYRLHRPCYTIWDEECEPLPRR